MFSLLYGFWEYLTRKEELRILILGLDKAGALLRNTTCPEELPNISSLTHFHCCEGKTTMLERLKTMYTDLPGLDADKILPTVGLNVGRLEAFKSSLMFWDLGGQTGLRSIWDKYYADSHAIIFVVDSSTSDRKVIYIKASLDGSVARFPSSERGYYTTAGCLYKKKRQLIRALPKRLDEAKGALEKVLGSLELFDAPLLVAANKQDSPDSVSGLEIQDHLGLGRIDSRPTRVQPVSALKGEGISEGLRWLLAEVQRSSRCSRFRQRGRRLQ